ncbi:hypothetical protein [Pararhodobacter sp.]|uniref:hypothetical protein n=1 Tax=Pararhodobacter sp. TaxID=2127056 RepID=UPI002FE1DCE9
MRILALAAPLALLGMAGCAPGPDNLATMTNSGVGFGDYQRYLRGRSTTPAPSRSSIPYSVPPETRTATILPPASMPATAPTTLDAIPQRERAPLTAMAGTLPPVQPAAASAAPIATQTLAPAASSPAPAPAPTYAAAPAASATAPRGGVQDQQVYHAGEAQRITPQGAAPQQAPIVTASIPAPSEHGGPNLMAYALAQTQAVGTETYRRINPLRWSRWENACLQYRNQDAAQQAFLEDGGPERDRGNLDPDGDGFACWWDPTPLRQALARR